jgi:hypothetical protein
MLEFFKTQDSKPFITDKKGTQLVNFIEKDMIATQLGYRPIIIDYYLLTADDSMRADLVTQKMYGYLSALEGVLKFNGISNPFCLEEGDVLYTFDVPSMNANMRTGNTNNTQLDDIREQYITPEKKSTVDPALRSFDKRDTPRKPNPSKGNEPALPPNYAAFGDTELQVRNGKIVFGPNVTKQDEDCDKPLSKSEFISRLIKNRLNNK